MWDRDSSIELDYTCITYNHFCDTVPVREAPKHAKQTVQSEVLRIVTLSRRAVLYCGRVPAANAPGCTAAEGLLYKSPRVSTRDPSSERRNYLGEKRPVLFTESCDFHAYTFGFFYMPQISDMGQTALLPFRRKACWGFFSPWQNLTVSAGFEPANLGTKGQHARPSKPLK